LFIIYKLIIPQNENSNKMKKLYSITRFIAILLVLFTINNQVSAQDYVITIVGNTLTITDASNNSDLLLVVENGANIEFNVAVTPRTFSLNGSIPAAMPAIIPLASIDSIIINTQGGNDKINFGTFTLNDLPNVTVNGGTGGEKVTFFGDITFLPNSSLNVNLQDDDIPVGVDTIEINAGANIILSGTGTADLQASGFIKIGSLGSLETEDGDITIEANQQAIPTTGNFSGVIVENGLIQAIGTGDVTVRGKGGTGGFDDGIGVRVDGVNAEISSSGGVV
jgi:hypothetical protein